MDLINVLLHPRDDVVFEGALDELVKKVGSEELMDVGTREVRSKGLQDCFLVFTIAEPLNETGLLEHHSQCQRHPIGCPDREAP